MSNDEGIYNFDIQFWLMTDLQIKNRDIIAI